MIRNFLETCDYEHGYKKAITDIKNWFDRHSESIRYFRMFNKKGIHQILSEIEKNSDTFIEKGEFTEIIIPNEKRAK